MGRLPFRSGSGASPKWRPSSQTMEELAETLGVALPDGWQSQLEALVENYLNWIWCQFDADTRPIHQFYERVEALLGELEQTLDAGPVSDDDDVKYYARYGFNRAASIDGEDYARLPFLIGQIRGHFSTAKEWLASIEKPARRGPKTDENLDLLIYKIADFFVSLGVRPTDTYRDSIGGRDTPFIRFVYCLYSSFPPEAQTVSGWATKEGALLTSRVRRVLLDWRQKRAEKPEIESDAG